ncbi:MAG: copper resistance CopC/CopD family protein [Thermoleophilia bacterium]
MTGRRQASGRRRGVPAVLLWTIAAIICAAVLPGAALAHAVVETSSPGVEERVDVAPERVRITFSEPVQLLRADDADVVDGEGTAVSRPARVSPRDARVLDIPLATDLDNGTYTVRYSIIGADSHVIPGVFVFGIGPGDLGPPYSAAGVSRGPSETGGWGVSSRFLQLVTLGGLVGLLAFRWLVWFPAVRGRVDPGSAEGEAILVWGRDAFWLGFGILALVAMVAEGYLLVVQSAGVLGVGVLAAVQDSAGISQVLSDTDFGSLVQLRGALLFGVFALGSVVFIREYGLSGSGDLRAGRGLLPSIVLATLLVVVLGGVAAQGHPRVAPLPALQIGAQLVHMVSVAVWMTGLALVALALLRLPRAAAETGPAHAARLLAIFSRVALVAVGVAVLTGVIRSLAELGGPEELWETAYGRSIVLKVLLLVPIGALALYNRRILAALRDVARPSRATLRRVRRMAGAELVLSLGIVVVASLLVAQVPGG